jgi:hypothetical protein
MPKFKCAKNNSEEYCRWMKQTKTDTDNLHITKTFLQTSIKQVDNNIKQYIKYEIFINNKTEYTVKNLQLKDILLTQLNSCDQVNLTVNCSSIDNFNKYINHSIKESGKLLKNTECLCIDPCDYASLILTICNVIRPNNNILTLLNNTLIVTGKFEDGCNCKSVDFCPFNVVSNKCIETPFSTIPQMVSNN